MRAAGSAALLPREAASERRRPHTGHARGPGGPRRGRRSSGRGGSRRWQGARARRPQRAIWRPASNGRTDGCRLRAESGGIVGLAAACAARGRRTAS
eukprot:5752783-Prymnesium_polylepis.2